MPFRPGSGDDDLPWLPNLSGPRPRFGNWADDEAFLEDTTKWHNRQAARAAIAKQRHKAQQRLHEQRRGKRDRSGRKQPSGAAHRKKKRLLAAAELADEKPPTCWHTRLEELLTARASPSLSLEQQMAEYKRLNDR